MDFDTTPKIVMADSDVVESFSEIAAEFLKTIFDLDYEQCFISDYSQLSDFIGCNVPEEVSELAAAEYTINQIKSVFDITVSEKEYLPSIFEKIRLTREKSIQ